MRTVNWRRVALGGVCAGLVFNIGGMTSAFLIGLPETFARFGVEPATGTALLHSGLRLGLGLAGILIYVGMRAGLGPGPATAIRVALLVWFVGYVPGSAVLHELGVLSSAQLAFALAWGVLESMTAVLVGAWLYRDMAARDP